MAPEHFRSAAVWGLPIMKFTLTYEGRLPSSGNKPKNEDKWRIRKELHPQFVELWDNHPALLYLERNRQFPVTGGLMFQAHHEASAEDSALAEEPVPGLVTPGPETRGVIDLCEPIEKFGASFRPLIRDRLLLHCGLKILFLRREEPGRVYQAGDIDGRVKTLLDALAMPQHREQLLLDSDAPDPILCLLEDDSMISGINVESERLLAGANQPKDYAKLTIEVDVRVRQPTMYNQCFLGG